jgi:hypothetical protein
VEAAVGPFAVPELRAVGLAAVVVATELVLARTQRITDLGEALVAVTAWRAWAAMVSRELLLSK